MSLSLVIKVAASVVAVLFVVSLAGLIAVKVLQSRRPQAPTTLWMKRVEPLLAGTFAVSFALFFAIAMVGSFRAMAKRAEIERPAARPAPVTEPAK